MQGPSSPNNKNIFITKFTNLLGVKSRCSIFKKILINQFYGVPNKFYSLFRRHLKPDVLVVPKSPNTITMVPPTVHQRSAMPSFSVAAPQNTVPLIMTTPLAYIPQFTLPQVSLEPLIGVVTTSPPVDVPSRVVIPTVAESPSTSNLGEELQATLLLPSNVGEQPQPTSPVPSGLGSQSSIHVSERPSSIDEIRLRYLYRLQFYDSTLKMVIRLSELSRTNVVLCNVLLHVITSTRAYRHGG